LISRTHDEFSIHDSLRTPGPKEFKSSEENKCKITFFGSEEPLQIKMLGGSRDHSSARPAEIC
jgi:hypothetical protein